MRVGAGRRRSVLVNQSYAMQRVTGQQRYATEIASRLLADDGFDGIQPNAGWSRTPIRVWMWVMAALPVRAGASVLLSMTARAPLWQRRHVLVVHDLFVLTNPEWFSRRYYWTHAPLLRLQLRTAAALVAVSQPVADELAGYAATVHVAPNAPSEVFAAEGAPAVDDALRMRGLTSGRYFLTVGSMDPRKNLPTLAQAYARLSEDDRRAHPLVVVGGGSAVFRDQDIEWPAEVVDAGYVTDEELRQLYQGSLAVVFPSLAEGFGLPLVEAAAAGAPCLVISDIPVFRWVCGEAAHYVDPGDPASVAAGLEEAMRRPRRQLVDLERFSWDRSARIVRELCTAVAAAP
ncbi:glycosyltransferase family 4 protein [uncultured Friedmanniella sp.]|uniref:glycosyltransferase family 4 protein n=1 Tax=uncultured Friedmanniella sp. TaxID=335381 RepID=UPI0035C9B910